MKKAETCKLALLTDADGTLFDSFPLYNLAIDDVFLSRGYSSVPYETVYREFNNSYDIIPGTSWHAIFGLLLDFFGVPAGTVDQAEVCEAFYAACVARIAVAGDSLLLHHTVHMLEAVVAAGGSVAIHSGTSRPILDAMISVTGIGHLVSGSVCGDEVRAGEDDYSRHKTTLVTIASSPYPDSVPRVVLGDTKADVWAANELGMPVALVYHGYPKDLSTLDFGFIYDYNAPDASTNYGGLITWVLEHRAF